eukprot:CAMPEP_0184697770 /NCGR_PEP_ID=MMETSP0313-20130426/4622_1 /TAXON_ID=2792 /ORGANISM="Porphyridium aerugineum, Strain SAG 1380-2" /LENGTH=483 /DNA_ID=CAMNT_0027156607 /DNA_START=93 /DNA_END=1544 /DNA_ORIENTATION=+
MAAPPPPPPPPPTSPPPTSPTPAPPPPPVAVAVAAPISPPPPPQPQPTMVDKVSVAVDAVKANGPVLSPKLQPVSPPPVPAAVAAPEVVTKKVSKQEPTRVPVLVAVAAPAPSPVAPASTNSAVSAASSKSGSLVQRSKSILTRDKIYVEEYKSTLDMISKRVSQFPDPRNIFFVILIVILFWYLVWPPMIQNPIVPILLFPPLLGSAILTFLWKRVRPVEIKAYNRKITPTRADIEYEKWDLKKIEEEEEILRMRDVNLNTRNERYLYLRKLLRDKYNDVQALDNELNQILLKGNLDVVEPDSKVEVEKLRKIIEDLVIHANTGYEDRTTIIREKQMLGVSYLELAGKSKLKPMDTKKKPVINFRPHESLMLSNIIPGSKTPEDPNAKVPGQGSRQKQDANIGASLNNMVKEIAGKEPEKKSSVIEISQLNAAKTAAAAATVSAAESGDATPSPAPVVSVVSVAQVAPPAPVPPEPRAQAAS